MNTLRNSENISKYSSKSRVYEKKEKSVILPSITFDRGEISPKQQFCTFSPVSQIRKLIKPNSIDLTQFKLNHLSDTDCYTLDSVQLNSEFDTILRNNKTMIKNLRRRGDHSTIHKIREESKLTYDDAA